MLSKKLWRLRTYLYLLSLSILLPAVLLISWNGYSQYAQAEDAAKREVYSLANIGADNASLFLSNTELLFKELASRIQSRLSTDSCDPIFREFTTLFPQFANLSQSTPDGYIVCSSVPQPGNKKTFVGDTQWFKLVYGQNSFIVSQPYKGPVTGRMVTVLAYPLRDAEGKITGSLQLPIDLVNYELMPGASKLPKAINVTLFDAAGVIIARSRAPEKFIGKNLSGSESVAQFLKIRDGTIKSVSSEGIERIFGFRPVPNSDWLVVAGITTSEALKGSRATAIHNAVLASGGLALAVALAFIMSKEISGPITRMQETAARIAKGEYESRAYVDGPKEVADVARQFNTMLDALSHSRVVQAEREAEIHQLAFYDLLTGLANRRLLVQHIAAMSKAAKEADQIGAIMYIDLDHFKNVNDAYGHQAGDHFLKAVAHRLQGIQNDKDMLSRLGGDEFVYVAASLGTSQEAAASAALTLGGRIQHLLQKQFDLDGFRCTASASIGITLFPKIGDTSEILLHEADIAMYQVKQKGRNDVVLFESWMRQKLTARLATESDLQHAIVRNQLALYIQPQVDIAGKVTGAEALLRWNHPDRGLVSPAMFIPLAEQSNLIIQIGRWILFQGCAAQVAANATRAGLPLSINISPRQFRHPGFIDDVRDAIAETNADPAMLILEITEGVLIEDIEGTIERIKELVEMGVRFSIDDFGTGYSSLAYLKRLPLYELKIDKSFIKDTPGDASDTAIVKSIVGVAKHLGLHVVAEGVETQAQVDFLSGIGCTGLQGNLFAKPMPLDAWLKWTQAHVEKTN